jgi:hypothetical protein
MLCLDLYIPVTGLEDGSLYCMAVDPISFAIGLTARSIDVSWDI